jgi:hypothetical protein
MQAIRFRGHDGAMEAAFFVGEQTLRKIRPAMSTGEAGRLEDLRRPPRPDLRRRRRALRPQGCAYDLQPSDI